MRRVVVLVPSAFTLANIFFGFWAIVSAYNGNFRSAGWFIVFAGVLDMLDGRVARMSNTGTRFGEELDSLADVISFGMAPALLMYFLEFSHAGKLGWIPCYLYVVAAAIRLARFNVMTAIKPSSSWFSGIPSPAAGMTLAVYYPFSQTAWYRTSLAYLELQHEIVLVLMLALAVLMVSRVPYPKWPRLGFRTPSGIFGLILHIVLIGGAVMAPAQFLFPLGLFYLLFGILRITIISLLERGDTPDAGVAEGGPTGEEPDASPRGRPWRNHRTRGE